MLIFPTQQTKTPARSVCSLHLFPRSVLPAHLTPPPPALAVLPKPPFTAPLSEGFSRFLLHLGFLIPYSALDFPVAGSFQSGVLQGRASPVYLTAKLPTEGLHWGCRHPLKCPSHPTGLGADPTLQGEGAFIMSSCGSLYCLAPGHPFLHSAVSSEGREHICLIHCALSSS